MLGSQAQGFEIAGGTFGIQYREFGFAMVLAFVFAATAATSLAFGNLVAGYLVEVGILVGTQQNLFAASHIGVTGLGRSVDLILNKALFHGFVETALLLYFEEEFPSLLGNRHGEGLYIVRAGSRVGNAVDMRLLLEQQLLVAGDTLRKFIGLLVGFIEGSGRNRIYTSQSSRHGLGLRAEQIDISIEYGLVEFRSLSMSLHLAGTVASGIVLFYNLSPQHAGGTELGQLHEVVGRDAEVEFDSIGNLIDRETFLGKSGQPFVTPSQGETQLLRNERTGIVQHHGIDSQHSEERQLFHGFDYGNGLIGIVGKVAAFGQHALKRIESDRTRNFRKVGSTLFQIGGYRSGKLHCAFHARGEVQLDFLQLDTMQQSFHILYRNQIFRELKAQRLDTLRQDVQSLGVGLFDIGHFDVLTYQPVVVGTSATHVRIFTGKRIGRVQVRNVFGTIHGVYVKPFVCPPYELFVKISSFQVGDNLVFPFLCGDRRELVKQFFFTFCHSCY